MEMDKLFYILFIIGTGLWQFDTVWWGISMVRSRIWIRRNLGQLTEAEELQNHGNLGRHLMLLIEGADAKSFFPTVQSFFCISGILFITGLAVLQLVMSKMMALTGAVFLSGLPYFLMQVRLHERRVERSKEGDILVQELLNNYQIYDYNMQEAIEKTAMQLDGAPLGKRVYLHLAKGLQHAVTRKEVETLLTTFRYAFDTAWGNVLASNIFFAHMYGIKVDVALRDLLTCMTQSRKAMEYSRRENHEAKMMLLYLAPASFLLSIFFASRYFDFTLKKFMQYQFGTSLGIQWFFSMAFCYIVSLLIQRFLAKEKMDI